MAAARTHLYRYKRLWILARVYRAYRDLVQLPLKYLGEGGKTGKLPSGEPYGYACYNSLPEYMREKDIPVFPPGFVPGKKEKWYVFGVLPDNASPDNAPGEDSRPEDVSPPVISAGETPGREPGKPRDPFAGLWAIAGNPKQLAKRYAKNAYMLELLSCLLWLVGIGINLLFLLLIIQRLI